MTFSRPSFLPAYSARRDLPCLWALLMALVLAYPLHPAVTYLAAAGLLVICALGAWPEVTAVYVFMFLFDNVLAFPLLGGSLLRVAQLGIGLRLLALVLGRRLKPDRYTLIAAGLLLLTCGISYLYKGLTSDMVSFALNFPLMLGLRLGLRAQPEELPETARWLLYTYVMATVAGVLLGMAHNRFVWPDGGNFWGARFMGSHEPNFTAMFTDVALMGWLWVAPGPSAGFWSRARLIDALVLGVLLAGLLLTGSMTGLLMAGVMALLYLGSQRRAWRGLIARLAPGAAVAVALMLLCSLWARPQGIGDVLGSEASFGAAPPDVPNFISAEDYRAAHRAGENLAGKLYTTPEWKALRAAQGLPFRWEADDSLVPQDSFWAKVPVIGSRVNKALAYLKAYGPDSATSGRWGMAREKALDFLDFPLPGQLFGHGPDLEKTFMPLYNCLGYSHNSYLDMLTGFGVLGLAALLWWFVAQTRGRRFLGSAVAADVGQALFYARLALLLHAGVLSMHLSRVFIFFFL